MTYPLGGMEIQNNDVGAVELMSGVYDNAVFAADATLNGLLIEAGAILGRITASGDLAVYRSAAVDGSEVPIGILGSDIQEAAASVAINIRYLVSGLVRQNRLIVWVGAAPGTPGDPADITPALKDQLRDFTMVALETTDLSQLDNQ